MDEPVEIIHFAGQTLRIGDVIRQRCLWCGGLIEERDLANTAVSVGPDETPEEAIDGLYSSHWSGLVAVANGVRWSVPDPDDGRIPDRSCANILLEITR